MAHPDPSAPTQPILVPTLPSPMALKPWGGSDVAIGQTEVQSAIWMDSRSGGGASSFSLHFLSSWKAAKKGILRLSKGSSFCFCGRFSGNKCSQYPCSIPVSRAVPTNSYFTAPNHPSRPQVRFPAQVALVFWDMDGKIRDFWNDY